MHLIYIIESRSPVASVRLWNPTKCQHKHNLVFRGKCCLVALQLHRGKTTNLSRSCGMLKIEEYEYIKMLLLLWLCKCTRARRKRMASSAIRRIIVNSLEEMFYWIFFKLIHLVISRHRCTDAVTETNKEKDTDKHI